MATLFMWKIQLKGLIKVIYLYMSYGYAVMTLMYTVSDNNVYKMKEIHI